MKTSKKLIGAGVLTAIVASLCCITPVLALIAGTSGIASTFSWLEPFRLYFIGITFIVLGFAWYQKIKPKKTTGDCCSIEKKKPFMQTKTFLLIITIFVTAMLAFPTYSHIFYPNHEKEIVIIEKENLSTAEFFISGMTCAGCEAHVENEVSKLKGTLSIKASFESGNAVVAYDQSIVNVQEIEAAILKTGYTITETKIY
jgi:copper chaperone CopZ